MLEPEGCPSFCSNVIKAGVEIHVFTLDQLKNLAAMQGSTKDRMFVKEKALPSK